MAVKIEKYMLLWVSRTCWTLLRCRYKWRCAWVECRDYRRVVVTIVRSRSLSDTDVRYGSILMQILLSIINWLRYRVGLFYLQCFNFLMYYNYDGICTQAVIIITITATAGIPFLPEHWFCRFDFTLATMSKRIGEVLFIVFL